MAIETAETMTLKRFLRVLAAGVISGGIYAAFDAVKATPIGIFIVPLQGAIISAFAKWLREKTKINLPL